MTAINTDKMKEIEAGAAPGPWNCSDGFIWCADGDLFGYYRGEGRIEPDDPNAISLVRFGCHYCPAKKNDCRHTFESCHEALTSWACLPDPPEDGSLPAGKGI